MPLTRTTHNPPPPYIEPPLLSRNLPPSPPPASTRHQLSRPLFPSPHRLLPCTQYNVVAAHYRLSPPRAANRGSRVAILASAAALHRTACASIPDRPHSGRARAAQLCIRSMVLVTPVRAAPTLPPVAQQRLKRPNCGRTPCWHSPDRAWLAKLGVCVCLLDGRVVAVCYQGRFTRVVRWMWRAIGGRYLYFWWGSGRGLADGVQDW